MVKQVLIVIMIVCFSCSAEKSSSQTKANKLIDSLFTSEFQTTYMARTVEEMLKEIEKTADSTTNYEKLYDFILSNDRYGFRAIKLLVSVKHEKLPAFILENRSVFHGYQTLCESLNWSYSDSDSATHHAFNSRILDILLSIISEQEDAYIREHVFELTHDIGTSKQVKMLHEYFRKETNITNRAKMLLIFLRYKTESNDQIIQNEFKNHLDYDDLYYALKFGLRRYNRHDFLPFLHSLKKQLKKETDVRKVESAKKALEEMKKVIPYLERKKREGVRPGLPLDWGVVSD